MAFRHSPACTQTKFAVGPPYGRMAALRGKGLLRGAAAEAKLVIDEFLSISLGSVRKGPYRPKKGSS